MNGLLAFALAVAFTPPAPHAEQPAASILVNCSAGATQAGGEAPNLHGNWDFLFDAAGTPNFGLLSLGLVDEAYGGSFSLWNTAPVVLRKITMTGNRIHMAVATSGGDVFFDGTLSPQGNRMCGTVTYHDGRRFPMVAQKRPSTYQPQPARRAR